MESKNNVKAAFFLFILTLVMVGGFILMKKSYIEPKNDTKVVRNKEEKKDIRIDKTKEYIYFENSERVVDELDIEYKNIVLNFNDSNSIASQLNEETSMLKKSLVYDTENEDGAYGGLVKASYKIYETYSYDNYLSLVVNYYNYDEESLVDYAKSKTYIFDKYDGKLYSTEEILKKYNKTIDDAKNIIKTYLEDQKLVKEEEEIDVELSLENLNDLNLFVDKMGNLSASILVKSNVKDYNDIVILN